jgi:hypothetical protein
MHATRRWMTGSSTFFGATDAIVTSTGTNDSGMFEANLRDGRMAGSAHGRPV